MNRTRPLLSPAGTRAPRAALRAALATALLATAAAALPLAAEAQPAGAGPMAGMALGPGRGLERALDAVGATAEQKQQLKTIHEALRKDLQAQREAGRALHQQLQQAFTAPTVDARSVEALRQQMLAQHDQASRRTMQAMLEASQVLTPEQRGRLAAEMQRLQQRRTERGAGEARGSHRHGGQ